MFDHLIEIEPEVFYNTPSTVLDTDEVAPAAALDAKIRTKDWLAELGAVDSDAIATDLDTQAARTTFANLVTSSPDAASHTAIAQIKTPEAVRHIVGMLTAYDWEFVQQAKELRGYAVAKLVEETTNPSASIRLKALGLLGKVTEVGLFTDKIEIKKDELTDTELDQRIKDKLSKFMGVVDILEVTDADPIESPAPTPEPDEA
jgi:HEAT repeat protein